MRLLLASLLFAGACSSAYAEQPYGPTPPTMVPRTAIAIAPAKVRAPYDVQVIREGGDTSPTFALKDRFYVQGNAGERYIIRITNPTPRRVEAVVTVDGLDVIDGEPGDLRKRGYVVPPYGEVRIEGFRTSTEDVATFRFSSVNDSYAGQKGKARNVGVIAAAIFEEQAPPPEQQIVAPGPTPPTPRPYDYRDDVVSRAPATGAAGGGYRGGVADKREAPPPPAETSRAPATKPAAPRMRPPTDSDGEVGADYGGSEEYGPPTPTAPVTNRPGLGTEYGEQRYSAASYTKFVRNGNAPIAIAELRYNDVAGLTALGIHVAPLPDSGEIMTRETADPFPGDRQFARPPGR